MLDETCGVEAGPSGKSTPHERGHNHSMEKSHRHHNNRHHHHKKADAASKDPSFEIIHKLEKRFRNFLQLTTEKLDEQKEIDNQHYSELKHDITSMEKNLEKTTRNSAIEMIENVTKELDSTMKKWAKVIQGITCAEKKDPSSSAASSTFDIVRSGEEESKIITKAIVQRPQNNTEADSSMITSTPIRDSKSVSKANGHVVRDDPEAINEVADEEPAKALANGRAEVCSGCEHEEGFEGKFHFVRNFIQTETLLQI